MAGTKWLEERGSSILASADLGAERDLPLTFGIVHNFPQHVSAEGRIGFAVLTAT